MNSPNDVVITGLGMVSPIGIGCDAFLGSLQKRVSGIRKIQQYATTGREVHFAGELIDFEPKLYVKPRKSLKVMSPQIQMGVASATLAIEDAELDTSTVEQERMGVVYGSPMMYSEVNDLREFFDACSDDNEFKFDRMGETFPSQMYPLWMLKFLPNMMASHIGIAAQARGPNNSIISGDVSSLLAMIEATSVIRRGLADVMLTGGGGSRLFLTTTAYRGESNLSKRNSEASSRPFDASRDGMVLGEAASTIVLETRSHATSRGAKIYGTVAGHAATHAGTKAFAGMQQAIENSIQMCVENSGITSEDVDHVNAQGNAELDHDPLEAAAIRAKLGDTPVTAVKSYFGNVGAGSATLELSASLLCARKGQIPTTLNYRTPDPNCPINVVSKPTPAKGNAILKLNQARTGQAVALMVITE